MILPVLFIVAAISFMGILTKYDLCYAEDFSDNPKQQSGWRDSTQKSTLKWKVINVEKVYLTKDDGCVAESP